MDFKTGKALVKQGELTTGLLGYAQMEWEEGLWKERPEVFLLELEDDDGNYVKYPYFDEPTLEVVLNNKTKFVVSGKPFTKFKWLAYGEPLNN